MTIQLALVQIGMFCLGFVLGAIGWHAVIKWALKHDA